MGLNYTDLYPARPDTYQEPEQRNMDDENLAKAQKWKEHFLNWCNKRTEGKK